ncbi:MAG: bilin biosynthesis protein [Phormidesmis priestleyi Ana]|uniref:Bilin biosynthesis protein n=1 Tax=Phormidesmis priestleyi Ana TaxID=1666911 RepID=A0A0P8C7B5_9CYAN|nr:MAG: bilin biosynthesis protein [Phormidesmis priestleyi Ana]
MNNRFSRLFNLTEAQAIEILDAPAADSDEASGRYIAASHLVNFDTEAVIAALVRAVQKADDDLDNRIVRRKAVESLGRLKVKAALPIIASCLMDEDSYLVENAAWAIGEIGQAISLVDPAILEKLAQQLDRPGQSYRTIIHSLAALGYEPAADRIAKFTASDQAPIASAALSAMYRLKGDDKAIPQVIQFLQSLDVNARRGSIQDLIDANYYRAIPHIAQCPVSSVFRLRGIRLLAKAGMDEGKLTFAQVQPLLEKVICDHPNDVALIHHYDQPLAVKTLVQDLYGTDFGRCYLASKTLIDDLPDQAPAAMLESYESEGYNDYGAHYHLMRLFGWLKVTAAYDLLIGALNNKAPQFQKSRMAAAIALGELGEKRAITELRSALSVPIWSLQYAAILALSKLGEANIVSYLTTEPSDWLVQEKLKTL